MDVQHDRADAGRLRRARSVLRRNGGIRPTPMGTGPRSVSAVVLNVHPVRTQPSSRQETPTALSMYRFLRIHNGVFSSETTSRNLPDGSRSRRVPLIATGGHDGLAEHVDKSPYVHHRLPGAQRGGLSPALMI